MSSTKYNLLMIAHPDDETIFFGGLLQQRRNRPWKVICTTDANADGQGKMRRRQFERAMSLLKIKDIEWWGFKDIFEKRLPTDELILQLKTLERPAEVFTHGMIGEYLHPHHQDVSFSVHQAFADHSKVYSCSYNAFPDFRIHLTRKEFALKAKVLTEIYGSETTRFLNLLPATSTEGFVQVGAKEVKALYGFLAQKKTLKTSDLKVYRWLADYLKTHPMKKRPF